MIDPTIEARIPEELKREKIWTFTRTDIDKKTGEGLKIPMDPVILDTGVYAGISDINHLLTFEMLKQVRHVPDNWLPAFHLSALENQWAMVDAEPGGMKEDNPYLKIFYDYVEASRHDGLHGLLKVDLSYDFTKKTAVKMPKYDTEILLNNHFVTLTGKEPSPLYDPVVTNMKEVFDGIQEFATEEVVIDDLADTRLEDVERPLTANAQYVFDQLTLTPLDKPDGVDTSRWEFTSVVVLLNQIFNAQPDMMKKLSQDEHIALLYQAALTVLPPRKKFTRTFNDSTHGDRVNYLFYMVRKIVESHQP